MKTRLIVDLDYDATEEDKETIKDLLIRAANHLAEEGLLTGETPLEVKSWNSHVVFPSGGR